MAKKAPPDVQPPVPAAPEQPQAPSSPRILALGVDRSNPKAHEILAYVIEGSKVVRTIQLCVTDSRYSTMELKIAVQRSIEGQLDTLLQEGGQ